MCRFLAKIKFTRNCWHWIAYKNKDGYGTFRPKGAEKAAENAARTSYRLLVGEIPEGMHVLHHCDTPDCVNPEHLFLGTNNDNVQDKCEKKRQARGQRTGKLAPRAVLQIRASLKSGRKLSQIYGVSPVTISNIRNRRTWKWL